MNNHLPHLFLAIALIGLMSPALAATGSSNAAPSDSMHSPAACHTLMTEQECGQFNTKLAQLTPGPARDRYLAEHNVMIQEREAACSCSRKVMTETIYPSRRQALLRF